MKALIRRFIASLFERQVKRLIARHQPVVVAVAGSVGKTSTKMAIATVLKQKYPTLVHEGNYNSELGLPLSVFELRVPGSLINPFAWALKLVQSEIKLRKYPYRALVLELGTDHPGEIARYTKYLKPDLGVITAITPEHMENFPGGLDAVAAEELTLVGACKQVLASHDDIAPQYRRTYLQPHPHHATFGMERAADYRVKVENLSGDGAVVSLAGPKLAPSSHNLKLVGGHAVRAAAAAFGAGHMLGLSGAQINRGLAAIRPVAGRMNPLAGADGALLIDDTYNSSPDAAIAALTSLAELPSSGRCIAILGTMNELGDESPRYHREVGAAAAGVDWLITVGADANKHLGPAAVAAGLDPSRWKSADSPYAAGEFVRLMLQPGDVVLAKGSQNRVFCEEAVALLLADANDRAKLVRQSEQWLAVKRRQFPDAPSGR